MWARIIVLAVGMLCIAARSGLCDGRGCLNPPLLGGFGIDEYARGFAVEDGIVYVVNRHGLTVVDMHDPGSPEELSYLELGNTFGQKMQKVGSVLYVTWGRAGLYLIDVSDPKTPRIMTRFYEESGDTLMRDLHVVGDTAYVANFRELQILDVGDPKDIRIVGRYKTVGSADYVEVSGDYAVVSSGLPFEVLDVSEPRDIRCVGSFWLPSVVDGLGLKADGSYAYVALEQDGFGVISLVDKASPELVSTIDMPGNPHGVLVIDNLVYLGTYEAGVRVIRVEDPSDPVVLGVYGVESSTVGPVIIEGDVLYVLDGYAGIKAFDVGVPSPDTKRWEFLVRSGQASGVWRYGDTIYCGDYRDFYAFDVSDPDHPTQIGINSMAGITRFEKRGGVGYALMHNHVLTLDMTDTQNMPQIAFEYDTEGNVDMGFVGDLLYVLHREGLRMYDTTSPGGLDLVGEMALAGLSLDLHIRGERMFVSAGTNGVYVLDIGEPLEPVLIETMAVHERALQTALVDHMMLVAEGLAGLTLFDISDVSSPLLIGRYETENPTRTVSVERGVAYISDGPGVRVLDIRAPCAPTWVRSIYVGGEWSNPSRCYVEGGYVYAYHTGVGAQVHDVPSCMRCDGDTNGDHLVDVRDLSAVLFAIAENDSDGDVNGDCRVDVNDIAYVLFRLGEACNGSPE